MNFRQGILRLSIKVYFKGGQILGEKRGLLLCGLALLITGITNSELALAQAGGGGGGAGGGGGGAGGNFNGAQYGKVCTTVLQLLEQDLGSLLTALAGLGAIVASAMGGFKMAWSLVVVSVGSFVLKHYQELWFAECS